MRWKWHSLHVRVRTPEPGVMDILARAHSRRLLLYFAGYFLLLISLPQIYVYYSVPTSGLDERVLLGVGSSGALIGLLFLLFGWRTRRVPWMRVSARDKVIRGYAWRRADAEIFPPIRLENAAGLVVVHDGLQPAALVIEYSDGIRVGMPFLSVAGPRELEKLGRFLAAMLHLRFEGAPPFERRFCGVPATAISHFEFARAQRAGDQPLQTAEECRLNLPSKNERRYIRFLFVIGLLAPLVFVWRPRITTVGLIAPIYHLMARWPRHHMEFNAVLTAKLLSYQWHHLLPFRAYHTECRVEDIRFLLEYLWHPAAGPASVHAPRVVYVVGLRDGSWFAMPVWPTLRDHIQELYGLSFLKGSGTASPAYLAAHPEVINNAVSPAEIRHVQGIRLEYPAALGAPYFNDGRRQRV